RRDLRCPDPTTRRQADGKCLMTALLAKIGAARSSLYDRRVLLIVMIVLVGALMSALSPYFLNVANLLTMTQYGAIVGLLALGQAIVILGGRGGIDLSVGSSMSLSGIIMGVAASSFGLN